MKVKKILIASVLKPIDDVRHYHKLAKSLAVAKKYQIFILGKGTPKKSPDSNIFFLPTGNFSRLSLKRAWIQVHFLKELVRTRPQLVILCAPELLPLAVLLKKTIGYKLIFDLQEDYESNIRYQKEYGDRSKVFFVTLFRTLKRLFRFVDRFILAEQSYASLFSQRESDKLTILENKTLPPTEPIQFKKWKKGSTLKLLFSGSISDYSGYSLALDTFKKTCEVYTDTELTIIGSYHDKFVASKLTKEAHAEPNLHLHISEHPAPHEEIVKAISESHLALITYLPDKVNQNRVPTKLFEYAGYGLPHLIQDHPYWIDRARTLGGSIPVNYHRFQPKEILDKLENIGEWNPNNAYWRDESSTLARLIDTLIAAN